MPTTVHEPASDRERRTTVTVIVPAFKEADSIEATVKDIVRFFDQSPFDLELVAAVDGDDETRSRVSALGRADSRVIGSFEPVRRGKGHAVRRSALLASGDIVGYVDADNKTTFSEFSKVEAELRAGADVVIGSRVSADSVIERRQRLYRRVGGRVFRFLIRRLLGLRDIQDTQCGFKFFRKSAARELFSRQTVNGYMFDVELLALASRLGYRIAQVPVRWRDDADSRFSPLSGTVRNAMDVLRIWTRVRRCKRTVRVVGAGARDFDGTGPLGGAG
jgi:dolichyl-phosphate beta-glucosyltransferase